MDDAKIIAYNLTGVIPNCATWVWPIPGFTAPLSVTLVRFSLSTQAAERMFQTWKSTESVNVLPLGYRINYGRQNPPTDVRLDVGTNTTYSNSSKIAGQIYYWQIVPYGR